MFTQKPAKGRFVYRIMARTKQNTHRQFTVHLGGLKRCHESLCCTFSCFPQFPIYISNMRFITKSRVVLTSEHIKLEHSSRRWSTTILNIRSKFDQASSYSCITKSLFTYKYLSFYYCTATFYVLYTVYFLLIVVYIFKNYHRRPLSRYKHDFTV